MNQKQRAKAIRDLSQVGDKVQYSQYEVMTQTILRKTDFNCFLEGSPRSTWNTIEWCFRNNKMKFLDPIKQAKVVDLYRGARTEKVPTI
jgi:hypothetical protein